MGLDADVTAARRAQRALPAAGVAALRSLADQIDQLERTLRAPGVKPYDRLPLAQLQAQFDDTYARTFGDNLASGAAASDPIVDALERFEQRYYAESSGAQGGDPADTRPA